MNRIEAIRKIGTVVGNHVYFPHIAPQRDIHYSLTAHEFVSNLAQYVTDMLISDIEDAVADAIAEGAAKPPILEMWQRLSLPEVKIVLAALPTEALVISIEELSTDSTKMTFALQILSTLTDRLGKEQAYALVRSQVGPNVFNRVVQAHYSVASAEMSTQFKSALAQMSVVGNTRIERALQALNAVKPLRTDN